MPRKGSYYDIRKKCPSLRITAIALRNLVVLEIGVTRNTEFLQKLCTREEQCPDEKSLLNRSTPKWIIVNNLELTEFKILQ